MFFTTDIASFALDPRLTDGIESTSHETFHFLTENKRDPRSYAIHEATRRRTKSRENPQITPISKDDHTAVMGYA